MMVHLLLAPKESKAYLVLLEQGAFLANQAQMVRMDILAIKEQREQEDTMVYKASS